MTEKWWREFMRRVRDRPELYRYGYDDLLLWRADVSPNPRALIYHQIQAGMKRVLTPAEKIRLDKMLDDFDVSRR